MIQSVTEICNSEKVKKICEPNVMQPQTIKESHVKRVIAGLEIYLETMNRLMK